MENSRKDYIFIYCYFVKNKINRTRNWFEFNNLFKITPIYVKFTFNGACACDGL